MSGTRLNPYYPGKMAVIRKERASADRVLRILDQIWNGRSVAQQTWNGWQSARAARGEPFDVPPPPLDYFSGPALIWAESDEIKACTVPWWKFWR